MLPSSCTIASYIPNSIQNVLRGSCALDSKAFLWNLDWRISNHSSVRLQNSTRRPTDRAELYVYQMTFSVPLITSVTICILRWIIDGLQSYPIAERYRCTGRRSTAMYIPTNRHPFEWNGADQMQTIKDSSANRTTPTDCHPGNIALARPLLFVNRSTRADPSLIYLQIETWYGTSICSHLCAPDSVRRRSHCCC